MANKHEKQRDFYKRMTKWREEQQLEVKKEEKKKHKIILTKAATEGIKETTVTNMKDLPYINSPEYKKDVEEANKKISQVRHENTKVAINSKGFICGETKVETENNSHKQDEKSKEEFKLLNGVSTSYTIFKTIDDDNDSER